MNHSTQKLWTSYFLESSDQLIEQDHWLTLASFPDRMHHEHLYILLQSSNILAHFSVTHESFTVHITHSTKNFFCIALLSMKKVNYTLRLTGLLKACSLQAQNWRHDAIDGLTRQCATNCAKLNWIFTVVFFSQLIVPWKKKLRIYLHIYSTEVSDPEVSGRGDSFVKFVSIV